MLDQDIIDELIRREGSEFTDHPHDRGGATKYGVTQRSWELYLQRIGGRGDDLPDHVKHLTREQAEEFYASQYIEPLSWIRDDELRGLAVDCGVNHGLSRATRWLQEAADVKADGIVGPVTRAAVNTNAHADVYRELLAKRLKFYAKIATDEIDLHEPQDSDAVFLRGWINRACEFLR